MTDLINGDSVNAAVTAANKLIKEKGGSASARPIEFAASEDRFYIAVNWKRDGKRLHPKITATTDPNEWDFKMATNHPVIYFDGELWFFGIV